ncbi:exonuclease domain-containing protein [Aestuariibius insulae]|uniref:3'-5' exonuclease n=1 Tax=Aestuariibius insulae TaxID=2058287 RepID=UPI00345EC63C
MFAHLGLRLRVFLFFCLLAVAGIGLAGAALALGWSRAEEALPTAPFVTAFVVFALLNTAVVLGVWLLFDENISKPINALSAGLRLRAHSGVNAPISAHSARYLGDLAPAAEALSQTASASVTETATRIARETERLKVDSERLTAVLTEAPVATILLNAALEIVLYDTQAADVMASVAVPRLRAPIRDYFDMDDLSDAMEGLSQSADDKPIMLRDASGARSFEARLRALRSDGYMIFIDDPTPRIERVAPRPLVFDFDLMTAAETKAINDRALTDLCFVAFDTETTGLSVEKDAIVQIGAVRVLNGRIVEGEVMESYVNPGRPIPASSTRIHQVTDADVTGAPDIKAAGRAFHHFARDAVLVAHNAPFDIGLLRRHAAEIGVEWDHPVLDTVLLSAVVFGTNEDHSLDALCARLSVEIAPERRHTALGDAMATAEAVTRLLPLLEGKGLRTFGALLGETRRHSRLLEDLNPPAA